MCSTFSGFIWRQSPSFRDFMGQQGHASHRLDSKCRCSGCVGYHPIMAFIPQTAGVLVKGVSGLLLWKLRSNSKYAGSCVHMSFISPTILSYRQISVPHAKLRIKKFVWCAASRWPGDMLVSSWSSSWRVFLSDNSYSTPKWDSLCLNQLWVKIYVEFYFLNGYSPLAFLIFHAVCRL